MSRSQSRVARDPGGCAVESLESRVLLSATQDVVIGAAGARSVRFTGANGTPAAITLSGGGSATVHFSGDTLTRGGNSGTTVTLSGTNVQCTGITATGTTAASTLTIAGGGAKGAVAVNGDVTSDGSFRSVAAAGTGLTGSLTVAGTAGKITLGSATGGAIHLGGAARAGLASITLGAARGEDLTSAGSLQSIKVGSISGGTWNVQGGVKTLTTSSIDGGWSATITGLVSSVRVARDASMNFSAASVKTLTIGGNLSDSKVAVIAPSGGKFLNLQTLRVRQAITNTTLDSNGSIHSVAAASMSGSHVFAGVGALASGQTLPASAADFSSDAAIGSVTLKKSARAADFSNSEIAAPFLGNLSLGVIAVSNGGTPFGVSGTQIASVTGTAGTGGRAFAVRSPASQTDADGQVSKQHLDLKDFQIKVVASGTSGGSGA